MKEMKIVREKRIGKDDWYSLYVEDTYITGSYDKEKVNLMYEEIKANPNLHINSNEVIKSTTINID